MMNTSMIMGENIMDQASGYMVSTARLREIVYQEAGVPDHIKELLWKRLEANAIKGDETDSCWLGFTIGNLFKELTLEDAEELRKIMVICHDMNNLPLVRVHGKPVDGTKLRFAGR